MVSASRQSPVLPASAAPVSTQPTSPGSTAAVTADKALHASAPTPTATVAAAAAPGPQTAYLSPVTKEVALPSSMAAAAAPGAVSSAPCSSSLLPAGSAAAAPAAPTATRTTAGSTAAATEPVSRPIVKEPASPIVKEPASPIVKEPASHEATAATDTTPGPLLKSVGEGPDSCLATAAARKPASTVQPSSMTPPSAAAVAEAATQAGHSPVPGKGIAPASARQHGDSGNGDTSTPNNSMPAAAVTANAFEPSAKQQQQTPAGQQAAAAAWPAAGTRLVSVDPRLLGSGALDRLLPAVSAAAIAAPTAPVAAAKHDNRTGSNDSYKQSSSRTHGEAEELAIRSHRPTEPQQQNNLRAEGDLAAENAQLKAELERLRLVSLGRTGLGQPRRKSRLPR